MLQPKKKTSYKNITKFVNDKMIAPYIMKYF